MNTIKKAICGGMIGLAGLAANGCTTAADAYGQALFENVVIPTVATSIIQEGVAGELNPQQTNVNVYNNGNGQRVVYQQPAPIVKSAKVFTCNLWKDLNGDGAFSNDEIIGLKYEFSRNEPMKIAQIINGYEGYIFEIRVTGPVKEGLNSNELPKTSVKKDFIPNNCVAQEYEFNTSIATPGKYLVDCFASKDGQEDYLDSCSFNIR